MGQHAPSASFHHVSVLRAEVTDALRPAPGRLLIDGTLGGGGHAEALLEAGADVIGVDRDLDALRAADARLTPRFQKHLRLLHGSFGDLAELLRSVGVSQVHGIVLDLGVSSWQIDTASRGFSFQQEGPLDMRMDATRGTTAADLVNSLDEASLADILRKYGEERQARRIAGAIVRARSNAPLATTTELAGLIERAIGRRGRIHPATRTFQALRIAVNGELDAVSRVLDLLPGVLAPGARAAIITFHSLEDRLVKLDFRRRSSPLIDRPDWPAPKENPDCFYKRITRKPIVPGKAELAANPRARSARLRIVERLATTQPAP